ncbi:MAG TPA: ImmA/IrrE family metallo-endopeptidase [Bryobacteraceae bacterium]|nr:ImmA/IrrE family metallo-endopeptidase [Bryobacteraceae bacterium]
MSVRSARHHGEALAEACGFAKPPVDVERVARHLGLKIAHAELGEDVSGLLISKGATSVVAVQASDHPNRRRFTIAHEIAHFYLRHQFEPGEHVHVDHGHAITPRNSRSSTGEDLKEIEANQFAACLLMPSKLVEARIKALKTTALRDYHVTLLADEFEVSEQAMTIRLSTLGHL